MKYTAESIGSRLIETITNGLYDGNLNCLREYVQNGVDSGAKNIEIYFEGRNNLIIKDDGAGMDAKELDLALNIGVSKKSDESVGWRGIGIWSGVPACKKIILITKKCNNNKYRVEIDNDVLRIGSLRDKSFLTVFEEATGEIEEMPLGKDESLEKDHFTEIRLESILKTQKAIFSHKEIRTYLSSTIPAPFNESNFSLAKEVDKWLKEENAIISDVNILFENKKIFRYPDRSDIFFNEIIKKEFIVRGNLIAAGWFIASKENKVIPAPNGGIYFKKKGFTLGDANLIEKLNITENYSRWQYGEIHIISKELRENAARNNFEYNNPYIEDFQKEVGTFINELQNVNRYQSGKIQTKLITVAKEFLESGDFDSAEQALRKAIERISKSRKYYPSDIALCGLKKDINAVAEQNIQEIINIEKELKSKNPHYQGDMSKFIEKARNSINKTMEQNEITNPAEEMDKIDEAIGDSSDDSEDPLIESATTETKPMGKNAKPANDFEFEVKNDSLMEAVRRNMCPAMKASVARSTKKGLEHFEISATDAIKEILIKRTGYAPNKHEIYALSKLAYGWDEKKGKGNPWRIIANNPILSLDPINKRRNRLFGIMIYIVHDLIVNLYKHERGKESFKWFEDSPEDDQKILIAEAYAIIDFVYRLIDKSEKRP